MESFNSRLIRLRIADAFPTLTESNPIMRVRLRDDLRLAWQQSIGVALTAMIFLSGPDGFIYADEGAEPARGVDFARDIRPVLASNCWNCHGPDEQTRQGDLRLDDPNAAAYVLEQDEESEALLIERITSRDVDLRMPPPAAKKQLTPREVELLQQWVAEDAPYETHWAFKPPERPLPPGLEDGYSPKNPIDSFVMARLRREELRLSPEADRRTLIRRLYLDVVGIPPTPEEVRAFVEDASDLAFEKVVDRVLESPHYGEHMAVPWLDAARYADTDGYQNDRYRYMHAWRDWVVMALNENKPYDEFLTEQIAGDMLPEATLKQQVATGFCRNHRINSEDGSIPAEWHVENVVDRVDTLGTAVLGLTIGCARCHDHKYDPLPTKEYYQLFAYFNNVPEWGIGPNNGNSPPFVRIPESWPNISEEEDVAQVPEALKLSKARETKGNGLRRPQPGDEQTVMVMHEMDQPRETYLLMRGQFDMPDRSEKLLPSVPKALGEFGQDFPPNRLGLAQWVVHPQNPLTARVAVNRMWQQFFGMGLVKTSENFGLQGELPSHPELLDWLAVEFVQSGWNVKALQKMILTSATYRQDSRTTGELEQLDPENRLLARGPRFRLHPFSLRDSMLASSGLLVETLGGPPTKPYMPPKIWSSISNNKYHQDSGEQLYRRSVYTFWRRTIPPPDMVNFNSAEREVCIVRKDRTNTPLQALTLMNNVTFVEAARFLAERMMRSASEPECSIRFGFRELLCREPTEEESKLLSNAYNAFLGEYTDQESAALELLSVGETPRDDKLDPVQHAAMTMTASLIMNLDEAITKE